MVIEKSHDTMKEQLININELHQDTKDLNSGTGEGQKLMLKSLSKFGAGRSILADMNNNIIAGNKTHQAAIKAGLTNARIIETDGTELIVVKRKDIDINTQKGRELALADNATAKADIYFDTDILTDVCPNLGIDINDWNIDIPELNLPEAEAEPQTKAAAWHTAKDYKQPMCDLQQHLGIYKRDDIYFLSFFHASKEGYAIADCKTADHVKTFVDNALALIRGVVGINDTKGWCLITAPRRRHKTDANFATLVCRKLAEALRIPFVEDAITCSNRDRLKPKMRLDKPLPTDNVILFDDILTTGSTLRACRSLISNKNVICIIGINNN